MLGVSPSGYYEWFKTPLSNRAQDDARLLRLIPASFTASKGIYRAPRVFLDLREDGETCCTHRVTRLMRESSLQALHGYRTCRLTVGKPTVLIPNLLLRQFTVTQPNTAWETAITFIRTWEGWFYLPVILDLYSRKVVGWAAGPTIAESSACRPCWWRCAPARSAARSRHPVRKRCVASLLPRQPARAEHEPQRQLLR